MRFAMALALTASVAMGGCDKTADTLDFDREPVLLWKAAHVVPPTGSPKKLKVMAWNIKYGAGRIDFWFDFWGDRVQMTLPEVEGNMERIYQLIREYDPDILLTEEIEINSRRSAYYDMVQGILDHTPLNYGAYFESWNSSFIPSEGLGRMSLGNAIFSKYPIRSAERIRQDDRWDQDVLTQHFYIHRVIGRAVIQAGDDDVAAYVVHTEAYDQDWTDKQPGTKQAHLQQIHDLVSKETLPFVLGGDFNELPPNAVRVDGFADEGEAAKGTDYEQPPYYPEDMFPFFKDFNSAISIGMFGATEAEQKRYYTHSTLGPDSQNDAGEFGFWNRTLDYLFVSKAEGWVPGSTDVLQSPGRGRSDALPEGIVSDPMELSDHAPVVGTWDRESVSP